MKIVRQSKEGLSTFHCFSPAKSPPTLTLVSYSEHKVVVEVVVIQSIYSPLFQNDNKVHNVVLPHKMGWEPLFDG